MLNAIISILSSAVADWNVGAWFTEMELGFQEWNVSESVGFYVKLATALLFIVLLVAWRYFFSGRKGRLPPGPFPLPIIGNLHMLATKLPHRALAALSVKHGPLMSLRLGSALTLVVSSPDMAKEFLKTHDQLFANKAPSAAGKHLTFGVALYWRRTRKLCVSELLSSRRLDYFRFIREEEVSAMIRSILHSDYSRPLNIKQTTSTLATAIICRMAFSKKYSDQDLRRINSMMRESFLLLGSFNIGEYVPYLDWMDLQGLNRRLKKLHETHDQLFEKVIEEHEAKNDPITPDLVDVLLLAASADKDTGFQLSRDSVKGILFNMLLGGSDTAPTTTEWAISAALRNPPVMKKLQDELERVVGLDRMVCESDLPRLVYLQAVVKETLRLYPPGPFLTRYLSAESCNILGYEIPQNTGVLINLWALGRNPKSWEDAEIFKPERFMEGVGSGLVDAYGDQNYGWLGFGAGRRGCPGQQLGTLVIEFGVAQLLHCFNWRLPMNGQNQELDMTERINGVTMTKAQELMAIPTPRLESIANLKYDF